MDFEKEFKAFPFHVSYLSFTLKNLLHTNSPVVKVRRPNFWTVGMATYLDKANIPTEYWERFVMQNNSEMWALFPTFYKFQLEWFEYHLQGPVRYMPGQPMPGFHLFKYCEEFEKPLARPHVDVPENDYNFDKFKDIFTHVVPVEMPEGGGMKAWNITSLDFAKRGVQACLLAARTGKPEYFVNHKRDQMILHSGKYMHQIKPFSGPTEDWRITLQSHAVWHDNFWNLYW